MAIECQGQKTRFLFFTKCDRAHATGLSNLAVVDLPMRVLRTFHNLATEEKLLGR